MKLNRDNTHQFISTDTLSQLDTELHGYNELLHNGKGAGSDFLGWVTLPSSLINSPVLDKIEQTAKYLRSISEVVIVIGIGGSYLGSKAVIDACSGNFDYLSQNRMNPHVIFAGQNISEDYTYELLEATKERSISVVIISKSGTTTEPAIAFRLFKSELERRYGKSEASKRIVAITDSTKGALRSLVSIEGYSSFDIPDDVGGRFSVLTPVGLLPIAIAGLDIRALIQGSYDMEQQCGVSNKNNNPAIQYASARTALYRSNKKIEILACYEPQLTNIGEWWKQLYGESEGKSGKGIFPASITLTSDLHSMGQYIQDGERSLFETVISVKESKHQVTIEANKDNLDGLNFLQGKRLSQINRFAQLGTLLAHIDGSVPNIEIEIDKIDEYNIGSLLYFFEKACGISGYALGVNPFDQPGVEGYKNNMFALLGKPGYESQTQEILKRV